MPDNILPRHTMPVLHGADFCVSNGANLGDGLSFAEDMVLDDVYRVKSGAERVHLSLRADEDHFTIDKDSEVGFVGAPVCLDCAVALMCPDGQTTDALVLVELDENTCVSASYLLPLAPMLARTDYALVGIDTQNARAVLAQIACLSFTRGTHITMANGMQRRIETLNVGDRVLTRDAGVQEIRWIGNGTSRASGQFAPICIKAGVLHNENDLIVSPNHRLFIYQRSDKVGVGRSDLLVKAGHLVNGDTVTVVQGGFVEYFQLLFDDHHIIFAEGIAAESFLIDPHTAPALPEELSQRLKEDTHSDTSIPGLDVSETLLGRPDAADLLRRSSSS